MKNPKTNIKYFTNIKFVNGKTTEEELQAEIQSFENQFYLSTNRSRTLNQELSGMLLRSNRQTRMEIWHIYQFILFFLRTNKFQTLSCYSYQCLTQGNHFPELQHWKLHRNFILNDKIANVTSLYYALKKDLSNLNRGGTDYFIPRVYPVKLKYISNELNNLYSGFIHGMWTRIARSIHKGKKGNKVSSLGKWQEYMNISKRFQTTILKNNINWKSKIKIPFSSLFDLEHTDKGIRKKYLTPVKLQYDATNKTLNISNDVSDISNILVVYSLQLNEDGKESVKSVLVGWGFGFVDHLFRKQGKLLGKEIYHFDLIKFAIFIANEKKRISPNFTNVTLNSLLNADYFKSEIQFCCEDTKQNMSLILGLYGCRKF